MYFQRLDILNCIYTLESILEISFKQIHITFRLSPINNNRFCSSNFRLQFVVYVHPDFFFNLKDTFDINKSNLANITYSTFSHRHVAVHSANDHLLLSNNIRPKHFNYQQTQDNIHDKAKLMWSFINLTVPSMTKLINAINIRHYFFAQLNIKCPSDGTLNSAPCQG